MKNTRVGVLCAGVLASGCASGASTVGASSPSIATIPAAEAEQPAEVTVRARPESGLESVIGQQAPSLSARFGAARIDLIEGSARKLQFAGERCVLDIYLYAVAADTPRVATHVEARLRENGVDLDRAECIAELADQ